MMTARMFKMMTHMKKLRMMLERNLLTLMFLVVLVPDLSTSQSPPRLAVTVELQEEPALGTTLTNLITAANLNAYYSQESLRSLRFGLISQSIRNAATEPTEQLINVEDDGNVVVGPARLDTPRGPHSAGKQATCTTGGDQSAPFISMSLAAAGTAVAPPDGHHRCVD